jgi:hypothetical protein
MKRIDLADHAHVRHQTWESGDRGHWRHSTIEIGELDDGRWYAAKTTRRGIDVFAGHTERQVCRAADAWMKRVQAPWRETTGQDA